MAAISEPIPPDSDPSSPSRLMALPADLADQILSSLPALADLRALALTCRIWAQLIIPRHSEYRQLRLCGRREDVWRHLDARRESAANLSEVWLSEKEVEGFREVYPRALVEAVERREEKKGGVDGEGNVGEEEEEEEEEEGTPSGGITRKVERDYPGIDFEKDSPPESVILSVLSRCHSLERFKWNAPFFSGRVTIMEEAHWLFHLLQKKGTLKSLAINELNILRFARDNISYLEFIGDGDYPLYKIENLEEIQLLGSYFQIFGQGSILQTFLERSPNLQTLKISYWPISPCFVGSHFPCLRVVDFRTTDARREETEQEIFNFLKLHPTIEELTWLPMDPPPRLEPGFLPNLKRIYSSHSFTMSILRDPFVKRKMECICQISIGPRTWQDLQSLDGKSVKELAIWRYDGMKTIEDLARVVPYVRILEIASFGIPTIYDQYLDYTLDDYIQTLSLFEHLEELENTAIWQRIQAIKDPDRRAEMVDKLARWCPKLRRLTKSNGRLVKMSISLSRVDGKTTWKEEVQQNGWVLN